MSSQAHGFKQVAHRAQAAMHQMRDDFGVGLRLEHIAEGLEPGAQRGVVFDDAVVHHRHAIGHMRMGVALGGRAVRRPARVGHPCGAMGCGVLSLGGERIDPSGHPQTAQSLADHGQAGRVITAIFEPPEPFEQHGYDIIG